MRACDPNGSCDQNQRRGALENKIQQENQGYHSCMIWFRNWSADSGARDGLAHLFDDPKEEGKGVFIKRGKYAFFFEGKVDLILPK